MQEGCLFIAIIVIVSFDFIIDQVLDFLNFRNHPKTLPLEVKGLYTEEEYLKSKAYQKTKYKFGFLTSSFSFILLLGVLFTGFLGFISDYFYDYTTNTIAHALCFFGVILLISDLINIPFQLYSVFVIEEKYGFNKMTIKTFIGDKIKGYLIGAIIGGGILSVLILLIENLQNDFWIYFWIVISVFMLLLNMFYTSWIVPLFNKLTPLEEGELKTAIETYSKNVKFPLTSVFVINGSKRSSKANAYFSGLGKKKKIVLYDTLIENHTTEELVAILAHEVGHFKKKHIISGFVLSILQMGVMLFLLSLMIFSNGEPLANAIGGTTASIPLSLLAFGILYTPISKLTGIFMNIFSRKNEFEADAFASNTYSGTHLQEALKKLSSDNLSHLTPHPLYVFAYYSHPPLVERLRAIESIK